MSKSKAKSTPFSKDQVIIVGEGAQLQVYKVLDNFKLKDNNGTIIAALLKETQRVKVPIEQKPKRVFNVEVIPEKGQGWSKQAETIQFNQIQLGLAVKEIKDKRSKAQTKNQLNESSSEEKKPQQAEKQQRNKKAVLQTQIEDLKSVRRKGGKSASSEEKSSESSDDSPQPQVTPIHMAAINSDPSYLIKILKISQEDNISDELRRKPIHYAAVSDNDKCLKYLLDKGANPKEKDKLNYTPLMLAAQFGKLDSLKTLLKKNFNNREGNAARHLAAQYGNLKCLKELFGMYKQLRQRQNRCQPIHLAAAYGHFEIVEYLKDEAKANINSKDKYGRTPLAGFAECFLELKKSEADQNSNNNSNLTPLGVALAQNHC